MDTINLKEQEIAEMRLFYQEELSKTLSRLDHVRSVLEKLGVKDSPAAVEESKSTEGEEGAAGVKLAGIKKQKKERKRPGRKSQWETLFIGILKQANRPMTYIQLTNAILTVKNLDKSKFESTKQAVLAVAYRLRARDGKIGTFTIGNREKYVALVEWYDSNGYLKQEYKDRLIVGDTVPISRGENNGSAKAAKSKAPVKKGTVAAKSKTAKAGSGKRGRPAKKK